MSRARSLTPTVVGVIAVSSFLMLSACAPEPGPSPAPTGSETPGSSPYTGPAVFVGDELDLLLLTPDEITELLPGSAEVGASSSVLEQISDGGGPTPVPAICSALFAEQSLTSVGSRNISWNVPEDSERGTGSLTVLQFADEAHATKRMDQLVDAAGRCGTFDYNGEATFEAVIPDASENARAFAGVLTFPEIEGGRSTFSAVASVGNVIVQIWQPVVGDTAIDGEAVAELLLWRAEDARASLIDELTANPPEDEEDPASDASAPWSEWTVSTGGVGPIRLGDPIDEAVKAAAGAQALEPAFEQGPWRVVNQDGTASLLIQPEQGGTVVTAITVGNDRSLDETAQSGAALPARGDVRVGDAVAEAVAAYPGGTTVTVVSSGDDWYDVATRDGRLFRFHADRDVVDPGSLIVGITVEDATTRRDLVFD